MKRRCGNVSGPKYTDFVVERQRLLAIKAKLEAEIERGKCAQLSASISECIEKSDVFIAKIDFNRYEKAITEAEKVIKNDEVIHQFKDLIENIKSEITQSYVAKGNSVTLAGVLHSYENRIRRIRNLTSLANNLICELNRLYNEQQQENLEKEFKNTVWDANIPISNMSQSLLDTYTNIIEQLSDCEEFEKEKGKYDKIMKNHMVDDNFKISQMKMNFDAYLVERQSGNDKEFVDIRNSYIVLSNLIYGQCENIPNDFEVIKSEVAEMTEYLEKREVGEYVADCVDKVMRDLGYNVVGSEVLETQKMTKQQYDYSDNSTIMVASSENGALMLEVVGKKNEDGTDGSVSAVKRDMERFCPDYQKVKAGLQAYGIKLNDKKLCPPDEKYVRFTDIKKPSSSNRRITVRNGKKRMYNE